MVALRGTDIITVPISEALGDPKTLDPKFFADAEVFFG
jgi:6-phosphofructokinase 1